MRESLGNLLGRLDCVALDPLLMEATQDYAFNDVLWLLERVSLRLGSIGRAKPLNLGVDPVNFVGQMFQQTSILRGVLIEQFQANLDRAEIMKGLFGALWLSRSRRYCASHHDFGV